ncbi:ABC transporter substrate-binding protein [Saccharomonospora sp. NPDC046836]|uniref:ABC transporter substrate-binding protein n=1 Tax=Saccharomonospora sp. NPDC046836 TaxID=3156921 RepID=UPI0033E2471F
MTTTTKPSFSASRSRRGFLRLTGIVATAVSVAAVAGCGPKTGAAGAGEEAGALPDYYPAGYNSIVEGSKTEGGALTIYSNTDQENWAPVFEAFQAKFPWVTKINASNLDSDEVFQRVLSEQATNGSPADLIVSNAAQAWAGFAERPGVLADYRSPELTHVPDFAQVLPSVYAMSLDPMTISYNTALLPEDQRPTGLTSLARIAEQHPDTFRDKIMIRDVGGAFGFTVSYDYVYGQKDPEAAWRALETLLPLARPETSSGTQIEKITSGEYVAGFFISGAPAFPVEDRSGGLFVTTFLDDGTVVLPRAAGIAAQAPHPNTAKLFVDFLLSADGQAAIAKGGLTSFRDGVATAEGSRTYADLVKEVGEDNVIFARYEAVPEAEVTKFVDRWNGLLNR